MRLTIALTACLLAAPSTAQTLPALDGAGTSSQTISILDGSTSVSVNVGGAASAHGAGGTVAGTGSVGLGVNDRDIVSVGGGLPDASTDAAPGSSTGTADLAAPPPLGGAAPLAPQSGSCAPAAVSALTVAEIGRLRADEIRLAVSCAPHQLNDAQRQAVVRNGTLANAVRAAGYRIEQVIGLELDARDRPIVYVSRN